MNIYKEYLMSKEAVFGLSAHDTAILKKRTARGAKKGAAVGGLTGGAYGALRTMHQNKKMKEDFKSKHKREMTPEEEKQLLFSIKRDAARGAIAGAATGGAAGVIGPTASSLADKEMWKVMENYPGIFYKTPTTKLLPYLAIPGAAVGVVGGGAYGTLKSMNKNKKIRQEFRAKHKRKMTPEEEKELLSRIKKRDVAKGALGGAALGGTASAGSLGYRMYQDKK